MAQDTTGPAVVYAGSVTPDPGLKDHLNTLVVANEPRVLALIESGRGSEVAAANHSQIDHAIEAHLKILELLASIEARS